MISKDEITQNQSTKLVALRIDRRWRAVWPRSFREAYIGWVERKGVAHSPEAMHCKVRWGMIHIHPVKRGLSRGDVFVGDLGLWLGRNTVTWNPGRIQTYVFSDSRRKNWGQRHGFYGTSSCISCYINHLSSFNIPTPQQGRYYQPSITN